MDYTDLTHPEILDLIKEQRTAILNLKTDSTHTDIGQKQSLTSIRATRNIDRPKNCCY